jgi:hypothetical protein
MQGWKKIEDNVIWARLPSPMPRISDEWIEKAVFAFEKGNTIPSLGELLQESTNDQKPALPFVPLLSSGCMFARELFDHLKDNGIVQIQEASTQVLTCIDQISRDHAIISRANVISVRAIAIGPRGLESCFVGGLAMLVEECERGPFVIQLSLVSCYAHRDAIIFDTTGDTLSRSRFSGTNQAGGAGGALRDSIKDLAKATVQQDREQNSEHSRKAVHAEPSQDTDNKSRRRKLETSELLTDNSIDAEEEGPLGENEDHVQKDMTLKQESGPIHQQWPSDSKDHSDHMDDFIVFRRKKRHKQEVTRFESSERLNDLRSNEIMLPGRLAQARQSIASLE